MGVFTEDDIERIKQIMQKMKCSKNFKCYKSNFDNVCKVKATEHGDYFEIQEEKPLHICEYAIHFGFKHYCHCPLRIFVARTLEKQSHPKPHQT